MTNEQTPKERLIEQYGHRIVGRVVAEEGWAAEVIFDIASGNRVKWSPLEWAAVLSDLERCKIKVKDWVDAS